MGLACFFFPPFVFLIGDNDLLNIPCLALSTCVRIFEGYISTNGSKKKKGKKRKKKRTIKLLVETAELLLKDSCRFILLSRRGDSLLASPRPQCCVMFINLVGKK